MIMMPFLQPEEPPVQKFVYAAAPHRAKAPVKGRYIQRKKAPKNQFVAERQALDF